MRDVTTTHKIFKDVPRSARTLVTGISGEARRLLHSYDWPGNVRQLQNAMERALVLGSTELILLEDLPEALFEGEVVEGVTEPGFYKAVKLAKRQIITRTLQQTEGNYTEAAKLLGIHPNNLHRIIRSLNLKLGL